MLMATLMKTLKTHHHLFPVQRLVHYHHLANIRLVKSLLLGNIGENYLLVRRYEQCYFEFFCEKKKSILTEHSKFCGNTSLHK